VQLHEAHLARLIMRLIGGTQVSDWSNNNLAHVHTWLCMIALHELPSNTTFDVAGAKTMNALAFWSDLDSPDQRAIKANTLASQMDNIFRLFQGAQYEPGIERAAAVGKMSDVLQGAKKNLKQLAAAADDCYRFKNEVVQ
jgi:hypothetical protein